MSAERGRRVARTPWKQRDAASRELGQVRRVIAEHAVVGRLPDPELVAAYHDVLGRFESAHAAWLASRSAPAPAEAGVLLERQADPGGLPDRSA